MKTAIRLARNTCALGYLNANFRATARPIGKDPHRLDVTYTISEGPKVILGRW